MPLIPIVRATDLKNISFADKSVVDEKLQQFVSKTIQAVKQNGDSVLFEYTSRFDDVQLHSLRIPKNKLKLAESSLPPEVKKIFKQAVRNIRRFHKKQIFKSWQRTYKDGTILGEVVTPLDRVGLYVPGGKAFYPSTLLMNVIPAQIAGVQSIMVTSPPGKDGQPHRLVLGICSMLGIDELYSIGGAQAIAAMAYGTESIESVCKITGPGNRYVTEAKRQVFGQVGIDSIAGPSEIVILHDDPTIPTEYLVRDLLTQAEHDEDARVMLITTQNDTAKAVQKRIDELVPSLPRTEIITNSLRQHGKIVLVDSIQTGIDLLNRISPEHVEILIQDQSKINKIRNAGAIFVGRWSTETIGDYFAGPNHTIPTDGAARYASPLSVRDFQKHSSLINYSQKRLDSEGASIAKFAELEELFAHAAAVRERMKKESE